MSSDELNKIDFSDINKSNCTKNIYAIIRKFGVTVDLVDKVGIDLIIETLEGLKDKNKWYFIKIEDKFLDKYANKMKTTKILDNFNLFNISHKYYELFSDYVIVPPKTIIFKRDIKSLKPCHWGARVYLKHTKADEEITWNQLLERHNDKKDIHWMVTELQCSIAKYTTFSVTSAISFWESMISMNTNSGARGTRRPVLFGHHPMPTYDYRPFLESNAEN